MWWLNLPLFLPQTFAISNIKRSRILADISAWNLLKLIYTTDALLRIIVNVIALHLQCNALFSSNLGGLATNLISLRSATPFCYLDSNSPKINVDQIFDLFYYIFHILFILIRCRLQISYQVKIKFRWWNLPWKLCNRLHILHLWRTS